jgi:glycerophosphoryl diester phosphodiesterase
MLVFCVSALSAQEIRSIAVHGHRGTRGTRPENTMPAFEEALRAGVDALELDMCVTRDNVVVVSHEPYITPERCLGPDGKKIKKPAAIRSLTLADVKKYDCGSLPDPKFPRQVLVPGARIPTLEEVFAMAAASKYSAAAKVQFNIETKIFPAEPQLAPAPAEFAKMVVELVNKNGMQKRTIVQSFDVRTLREIKKLAPGIRTSQLTGEELVDIVPALKSAKVDIWSPDHKWITADSIREAHAAGIQVAPWVINTPEEWGLAMAAGVDAIITDYPADLITYLKAKKIR